MACDDLRVTVSVGGGGVGGPKGVQTVCFTYMAGYRDHQKAAHEKVPAKWQVMGRLLDTKSAQTGQRGRWVVVISQTHWLVSRVRLSSTA